MDFSSFQEQRNTFMAKLTYAGIILALTMPMAAAQSPSPPVRILANVPADNLTITHWYKQNVYDPSDSKIGEIMDVLVDREGKIDVLIVGVGGFVGVGEKDVAVPFNAVQFKTKDNNKWYPVMNTTKDALKTAPGYKYDRTTMTWVPENAPATTGISAPRPETPPAPRPNNR
jgi:sporulation protein YlmC with PRC-barrel domain